MNGLSHRLAASAGLVMALSAQAAIYQVTDIGPYELNDLRHPRDDGIAVNNAGEIAGTTYTEDGRFAFVYRDATMQLLGTLGGAESFGAAINDRGDVAGHSPRADGRDDPFLWNGSAMRDLGTLGGLHGAAYGVNRSRQVAGYSYLADGFYHAFLRDPGGKMTDLGTLGGKVSFALGINEDGVVVGFAERADGSPRAFQHIAGVMSDLGSLKPDGWCGAKAVSNSGTVVGECEALVGSSFHAVRFSGGSVEDLGTLGGAYSAAQGVNDKDDIVGWSTSAGSQDSRKARKAFLYRDGRMVALQHRLDPDSGAGWTLREATGINNHGQIVGWGERDGAYRIFLLTPMDRE